MKSRHLLALLSALSCALVEASETGRHFSYVEAAYAYQSTDWGPFEEEKNATFLASGEAFEYVHAHVRYNDGDTYMPRGVIQDGW